MICLEAIANWASILTAGLAGAAWVYYAYDRCRKRHDLENYLKGEKEKGADKGQRTFINIMAKTGLSEAEIFAASRASRHIIRRIKTDETKQWATDLLFEYERNGNSN